MATDTATLPTLTADLVRQYLDRAVQDYGPEYVDPRASEGDPCHNVYWSSDTGEVTGRCIAAQVLHYHGVTDGTLAQHNSHGVDAVLDWLDVPHDNDARLLLSEAQGEQDNGEPWAVARDKALHWAGSEDSDPE